MSPQLAVRQYSWLGRSRRSGCSCCPGVSVTRATWRLASVFRQVQAALLPWLARTPDELTRANTAASVMQSAAMVGGPEPVARS